MRIGIDARLLDTHRPGVNRYVHNIIQSLLRVDPDNEYLCFVGEKIRSDLPHSGNFRQVICSTPLPQPLNTLLDIYPRTGLRRVDLFHSLFPLAPLFLPCASVVTLHDFQPVLVQRLRAQHPEFRSRRNYIHQKAIDLFYRFTYVQSLKMASAIICISRETQNQLKEILPSVASRSRVIYYGLEKKFRPIDQADLLRAVKEKYSLPDRFIFYAGTNRPNKNLPRLIEAIRILAGDRAGSCNGLKLILAGFEHPAYPSSEKMARAMGLSEEIRHIGEVSHDELPLLYNLADAVILISFLEGFGFPPVEAMACGTPVIVARDSSLPEVVGDAGLVVDPRNVGGTPRAIPLLGPEKELRSTYSRAGLERAGIFNWAQAARETASVYSEVLRRSQGA